MKPLIYILLVLSYFSCETKKLSNKISPQLQTNKPDTIQVTKTKEFSSKVKDEQVGIACDSTKFPDYKENLTLVSPSFIDTVFYDKKAKAFIALECENDSLFCGGIRRIISQCFQYNREWSLELVGYTLDSAALYEKDEASFFMMTIKQNGQVWYEDIHADLMGGIILKLNGFEEMGGQIRVWGHSYPEFSSGEYGKFELKVVYGTGFYSYECKSSGH